MNSYKSVAANLLKNKLSWHFLHNLLLIILYWWYFMWNIIALAIKVNKINKATTNAKKLLHESPKPAHATTSSCILKQLHVSWESKTYPVVQGVQVFFGQEQEHFSSFHVLPFNKHLAFSITFWQIHWQLALEYTWDVLIQSDGVTSQLHWHLISSGTVTWVQIWCPKRSVPNQNFKKEVSIYWIVTQNWQNQISNR